MNVVHPTLDPPVHPQPHQLPVWIHWCLAGLIACTTLFMLRASNHHYGLAIDEATYVWVAREQRAWFSDVATSPSKLFDQTLIAERCHFLESPQGRPADRHSNFNLPGSSYVLNAGWLVGHLWLNERDACRLGSMLLFSFTLASVYVLIARRYTWAHGLASACCLLLTPRLFGHAHLAATETTLTCFWLLTCLVWASAISREPKNNLADPRAQSRRWMMVCLYVVLFGLLAGLTLTSKMSALLALPAFGFATVCFLRARSFWLAGSALLLAPLVTVLLTPNLWQDPIGGGVLALRSAANNPWKLPTVFLHRVYVGDEPFWAGWYLFAVTVPMVLLGAGLLSILLRPKSPFRIILLSNLVILMLARAAGAMPQHDADRQFLPAYAFLAILAGLAMGDISVLVAKWLKMSQWITPVVLALLLAEPSLESWQYREAGLSYFSQLVGGISGANKAGLEISYWLEAIPDRVLKDWLHSLPTNATIFLRPDHPGIDDLKRLGIWRNDLKSGGPESDFYLLYAKRSAYVIAQPATDERGRRLDNTPNRTNAAKQTDAEPSKAEPKMEYVMTSLWLQQQQAPAIRERKLFGVRLATLIRAR